MMHRHDRVPVSVEDGQGDRADTWAEKSLAAFSRDKAIAALTCGDSGEFIGLLAPMDGCAGLTL